MIRPNQFFRIFKLAFLWLICLCVVGATGESVRGGKQEPPQQSAEKQNGTDPDKVRNQNDGAADTTQPAGNSNSDQVEFIEEVSAKQVKRFLDPTLMISKVEYSFQANYLPQDIKLFSHKFRPWYAINNSNAVWVRIPVRDFSIPDQDGPTGVGDLSVGWGFIAHENLERRLTTVAAGIDVVLPTGDRSKGTGLGRYILMPAEIGAFNPTDLFPVFVIGRYLHSVGNIRGYPEGEGLQDSDVRSLELSVQTFHILPKGFFLAALPSFVFNFEEEFNIFSLGLGGGRALNRRLMIQGGYVQHIAGQETFNRGFFIGLNFLWGTNKSK